MLRISMSVTLLAFMQPMCEASHSPRAIRSLHDPAALCALYMPLGHTKIHVNGHYTTNPKTVTVSLHDHSGTRISPQLHLVGNDIYIREKRLPFKQRRLTCMLENYEQIPVKTSLVVRNQLPIYSYNGRYLFLTPTHIIPDTQGFSSLPSPHSVARLLSLAYPVLIIDLQQWLEMSFNRYWYTMLPVHRHKNNNMVCTMAEHAAHRKRPSRIQARTESIPSRALKADEHKNAARLSPRATEVQLPTSS